MRRRDFIKKSVVAGLGAQSAYSGVYAAENSENSNSLEGRDQPVTPESYLRSILYTRQEVEDWLAEKAFPFAKYSSEFGWLLRSGRLVDGVNDSICTYNYGEFDERILLNYADRPCRINTYGNSFTQCHQVNDAETWQEALAANLLEPVRNFGVGGWSVYQAYLRMLKEEERNPAELILFNIYEDDHFRNLDAWRNIRVRKHNLFIEPTLPFLKVNSKERTFSEHANPCPTAESVYQLADFDWVYETFKDDFALKIMVAHLNAERSNPAQAYADIMKLATTHGIVTRIDSSDSLDRAAEELHRKVAYFSTHPIIDKIEAYAEEKGKKVLFILSYPSHYLARYLEDGERPDQSFVDFLRGKDLPFVDLLETHKKEFDQFKLGSREYVERYYIGHYNPRGNFFCASAIRPKVIEMLDPKPLPYGDQSGVPRKLKRKSN